MTESILKTINTVKSASNHLYKFLSASAWSSLSLPDDLTLSMMLFQVLLTKLLYFRMHTSVSSHYVVGHQVVPS